jgi:hypothetical protein
MTTKMNKKISVGLILLFMLSFQFVHGQRKYTKFHEEGKITFYSLWKPSDITRENSPAELRLRIANKEESNMQVSFRIGFYHQHILKEESPVVSVCIKKGGKVTGKMAGLIFSPAGFTNEELQHEDFSWELIELKTEKHDKCR